MQFFSVVFKEQPVLQTLLPSQVGTVGHFPAPKPIDRTFKKRSRSPKYTRNRRTLLGSNCRETYESGYHAPHEVQYETAPPSYLSACDEAPPPKKYATTPDTLSHPTTTPRPQPVQRRPPQKIVSRFADGIEVTTTEIKNFLPSSYTSPMEPREWLLSLPTQDIYQRFTVEEVNQAWSAVEQGVRKQWGKVYYQNSKLTKQEYHALYIYSYEIPNGHAQIFMEMNRAMREGIEEDLELFRPLLYFISGGLGHLKPHKGFVFRGIDTHIDKTLYKMGSEIRWPQFSSTSLSEKIAQEFMEGEDGGTLFVILSLESRVIQEISHFPKQQESLFLPNSLFKVTSVVPESHLQMLGTNSDIVALRQLPSKGAPLEEKLEDKMDATKRLQFIYAPLLNSYVHPNGRFNPNATEVFELRQKVVDFLNDGDKQSLLLVGPSGSGKTTLALYLAATLSNSDELFASFHAMFLSLPSVSNIFEQGAVLKHIQDQYDFSDSHMTQLRWNFNTLFILDSFDEISADQHAAHNANRNLFDLNSLHDWPKSKVIITVRDEFLTREASVHGQSITQRLFGDTDHTKAAHHQLTVYHIAPFTNSQIRSYLEKMNANGKLSVGSELTVEKSRDSISWLDLDEESEDQTVQLVMQRMGSISGLLSLIRSPFLLSMAVDALGKLLSENCYQYQPITRYEVYDASLENHFSHRLARGKKDTQLSTLTPRDCFDYCSEVAMWLYKQTVVQGRIGDCLSGIPCTGKWESEAVSKFLFTCCPLRVGTYSRNNSFSFRHKSLLEFFVAWNVWKSFPNSLEAVSFSRDVPIINFLGQRLKRAESTEKTRVTRQLLQTITKTAGDSSNVRVTAASNSITILNASGYSFSYEDFSRISINNADLSNAVFYAANLKNATLQDCTLKGAVLDMANLSHANLHNVDVGMFPIMKHNDGYVASVTYSQSGKYIASCGRDKGIVYLWNDRGEEIANLEGHGGRINCVAFSPDGQLLLSCSDDKEIHIWDVRTQEACGECKRHKGYVNQVYWHPNGRFFVSCSDDKTIIVWRRSGRFVRMQWGFKKGVRCVTISPDGTTLLGGDTTGSIMLFDFQSGKVLRTLEGHKYSIRSLCVAPDNKTLLSGGKDKVMKIWDIGSGELMKTLSEDTDNVNSIRFNSSGKNFITANSDKTIRIWSSDYEYIDSFDGHTGYVNSVTFSPDEKTLVSGGADGSVRVWGLEEGDTSSKMRDGHTNYVSSVDYSRDGKRLVTGGYDQQLKIWSKGGELLRSMSGHTDQIKSCRFSPDAELVASVSADKTLRLWHAESGSPLVCKGDKHGGPLACVSWAACGKWLCYGSTDKKLRIQFLPEKRDVLDENWKNLTDSDMPDMIEFKAHNESVRALVICDNDNTIISGGADKMVRIWQNQGTANCASDMIWNQVALIDGAHKGHINTVGVSSDGTRLLAGGNDDIITVWSRDPSDPSKQPVQLTTCTGHFCFVNSVSFVPDSYTVVSAGGDGLRVWDQNGTQTMFMKGHTKYVYELAVNPTDHGCITSVSADKTVRIWQANYQSKSFKLTKIVSCSTAFTCADVETNSASMDSQLRTLLDQLKSGPEYNKDKKTNSK